MSQFESGIGMDVATILEKFLVIGESGKRDATDSGEAAGGFGVAKAVILGVSPTFRWHMHSRDNLAVANGASSDVDIFDAELRAGTRITVHDISPEFDMAWDHARSAWLPLLRRLNELLAANDLPDITLVLNGQVIRPMFSRRGGSRVAFEGDWGAGTSAQIKAYRRPPGDVGGAYYVRLNGLFQFAVPAHRGGMKSDVVVDLHSVVRPGQAGYPLNAARDAFQDRARWTFSDLVAEVEKENESTGASDADEVYDPDSDDPRERAGAAELAPMVAEAFADQAFQRALSAAAGGVMDFYAERLKEPLVNEPVASLAPRGSRVRPDEEAARPPVLPPGFLAAGLSASVEPDIRAPQGGDAVEAIRTFLRSADEAAVVASPGPVDSSWVGRRDRGILPPSVELALDQVAHGTATADVIAEVEKAIERAADTAMAPGGAGLLQVAAVPRVVAALEKATGLASRPRNPFGRHAGLRISKKTYDRQKAYRFKKNYGRWMPYLVVWDATLRLVSGEAHIRSRYKPGFVLDDNVMALTARTPGGTSVIYVHPDRFAQVVKAHRNRPIAIAAFLHGLACHELTHLDSGRLHANGHDERYVVAREDLGAATGHLLPAIAVLVSRVLRLPPTPEEQRLEKQAQELANAQKMVREQRTRLQALARPSGGQRGPSARKLLQLVGETLRARPPAGVDAAYVGSFLSRHRAQLERILSRALGA